MRSRSNYAKYNFIQKNHKGTKMRKLHLNSSLSTNIKNPVINSKILRTADTSALYAKR